MNCGQFEARLNLVLDQRRSPAADQALAAHALVCPACDELLADHLALLGHVSRDRHPLPSPGFANRVVVSAMPELAPPRRATRLLFAFGVALSAAAAMLLAISIVWKARQADPTNGEHIQASRGVTSADLLVDAPRMWSDELALALPAGAAMRMDEVEKFAPGIRPFRESLAIIWDALRRAWMTRRNVETQPAEKQTGQWAITWLELA